MTTHDPIEARLVAAFAIDLSTNDIHRLDERSRTRHRSTRAKPPVRTPAPAGSFARFHCSRRWRSSPAR